MESDNSTARVALDEIAGPTTGSVTIRGKEYGIQPLDGFGYQLLEQMTEANSVEIMYRVASRVLVPEVSFDELFGTADKRGWTPDEITAVVEGSKAHVQKVEATRKNAGRATDASGAKRKAPPSPRSRR